MLIWFVTIGEPSPTDENNPRLLRNGILANYLLKRGHEVFWWNSTFNHSQKAHRFDSDKLIELKPGYSIFFMRGYGYQKNISIERLIDHIFLGLKFSLKSKNFPLPEAIICSMPPIFLSYQVVKFAKKHSIPVILDLRDKWPDIFCQAAPEKFKKLLEIGIFPLKKLLEYSCKNATSLCGMTDEFVKWGAHYAGRNIQPTDRSFAFGYKTAPPDKQSQIEAFKYWEKLGIEKNSNIFTICYFGAVANQVVFYPIKEAFQILENQGYKARLIFCGEGTALNELRESSKDVKSIIFPGWIDQDQIWALMQISDAGLIPLRDDSNYRASFMNKSIEYMSAGLTILCSVHGVLKELMLEFDLGVTYLNEKPDELATAIIQLIENPDLLNKRRENVRKVFQEKFTEEKIYNEFVDFIESFSRKSIQSHS